MEKFAGKVVFWEVETRKSEATQAFGAGRLNGSIPQPASPM
jgi:hypothetical protein